jgi:hypothetical protein
VQEADHPQEIEKTEEEKRKAACGFGEIGENCDFTSSWKPPSYDCTSSSHRFRTRRCTAQAPRTVPKLWQIDFTEPSLCQNPKAFHWPGGSFSPELLSSFAISFADNV